MWEAKEVWPDKIVVGGLDATFLTSWTPEQIRDYTAEILRRSGGPERLMIGSADAVPQTALLENLRTVGEAVRAWRFDRDSENEDS